MFRFLAERPGHLVARTDAPAPHIAAPSLEQLRHEERQTLIEHCGPAHCAHRVRILRRQPRRPQQLQKSAWVSGIRLWLQAVTSGRDIRPLATATVCILIFKRWGLFNSP